MRNSPLSSFVAVVAVAIATAMPYISEADAYYIQVENDFTQAVTAQYPKLGCNSDTECGMLIEKTGKSDLQGFLRSASAAQWLSYSWSTVDQSQSHDFQINWVKKGLQGHSEIKDYTERQNMDSGVARDDIFFVVKECSVLEGECTPTNGPWYNNWSKCYSSGKVSCTVMLAVKGPEGSSATTSLAQPAALNPSPIVNCLTKVKSEIGGPNSRQQLSTLSSAEQEECWASTRNNQCRGGWAFCTRMAGSCMRFVFCGDKGIDALSCGCPYSMQPNSKWLVSGDVRCMCTYRGSPSLCDPNNCGAFNLKNNVPASSYP